MEILIANDSSTSGKKRVYWFTEMTNCRIDLVSGIVGSERK